MPYSDTDEDYDLGNGPPMPRQVYDWYQKNASPIGDMARQEYERRQQNPQRYVPQTPDYPLQPIANIPSKLYGALDWAGRNVAAPSLGQMADTYDTDWSNQPFIGVGEHGEFTGRLPALAGVVTPYLAGGAPGGSATLPAGVKLPGGKYGYPEGLEGGYHGTHTVFAPAPENQLGQFMDKFINTGEGAQAYGYGHYVGAKKGTGASYMPPGDQSQLHIGDQPWNPYPAPSDKWTANTPHISEQIAHDLLMDAPRIVTQEGHFPDAASVIADLKSSIAEAKIRHDNLKDVNPSMARHELEFAETDQRSLDFIEANKDKFKFETPGSLYHVEIKPPEESLMHWDKKIKEQSPEVQEKLKQVYEKNNLGRGDLDWSSQQDVKAGDWYNSNKFNADLLQNYPNMTGNGQALSEAMKEVGVPGLRFADQQSRGIFKAKEGLDRTNANIKLLTRILDEDASPAALADPTRQRLIRELETEKLSLENWQNMLNPHRTLQFEGKSIKKEQDIYNMFGGEMGRGTDDPRIRAMTQLWGTKDVDKAIDRVKAVIRVAQIPSQRNTIINQKTIEWLEQNRDKITLKEPDITHNYVIFDPKNLNPVHRERNMPKGYI